MGSEYFIEGSSLNPQRKARETAAEEKTPSTYAIVRTPSPAGPADDDAAVEGVDPQSLLDDSTTTTKSKKKSKKETKTKTKKKKKSASDSEGESKRKRKEKKKKEKKDRCQSKEPSPPPQPLKETSPV